MIWKGLLKQWENVVEMKTVFMTNAKTHTFLKKGVELIKTEEILHFLAVEDDIPWLHHFLFFSLFNFS